MSEIIIEGSKATDTIIPKGEMAETTEPKTQETIKETEEVNSQLGDIIAIIFQEIAKSKGGDELASKVELNAYEIKSLNSATEPIMKWLLDYFKIPVSVFSSVIALIVILVPRITVIVRFKKPEKEKENENEKETDKKEAIEK